MKKVLPKLSAKRIRLNFYRCFADINIVVKKANLSREWDAKPSARQSWVAGLSDKWIR